MANKSQLARLKQGVEGWNKWRGKNPEIKIDLSKADLQNTYLVGANLVGAELMKADLRGAILDTTNLSGADLSETQLSKAEFCGANLGRANLRKSDLYRTDLSTAFLDGASLSEANLQRTDLSGAVLARADLRKASLIGANLILSILWETDLSGAILGGTVFGDIDLSETKGLDDVQHSGPSPISTSTLELSKGKIPEKFLRGCGLSDWEIESVKLYQPGLSAKEVNDIVYRIYDLRANQAIQINPLFISYSHADSAFVDEMENHLNEKGIRFWRDIHDATSGRLEKVVDRAIRQNPIVLLILSEHSVKSDWVEHEARTARELEKELGRDVLCPVALDEAWKDCKWPERLREQIMDYNILDFSEWMDKDEFSKMFRKLIDGLDLFYKQE
jgi:hypothetical protein